MNNMLNGKVILNMDSEKYTAIIAGASLAGIGMALANTHEGKKVLIVERTSLIGSEFIDSICHGDPAGYEISTSECKALRDDMHSRNLISERDRIHLPPVASLLFKIVKDKCLEILFMTDITGIRRGEGSFEVDTLSVSGTCTFKTDILIDTTAEFVTNMRKDNDIVYKSINCYVDGITGAEDVARANAAVAGTGNRIMFDEGRFPTETVMKLLLDPGDDWITAREKLAAFIKDRPAELSDMKVICLANTFELHTASVFYKAGEAKREADGINGFNSGEGWYRIVSGSYDNLFEAYDKGLSTSLPED